MNASDLTALLQMLQGTQKNWVAHIALQGSQATLVQQVPKRTTQVEKRMMNTWSRKKRQVFALVDRSRTSEHIATMLQQSSGVVEKVLADLQAIGAIQR